MLYKSQFTNYNEKRSHPELNPFISAWDYVDKYKDDPDVYISFTEIDKIGLNPQSKYNTPLGIYTYPLKEFIMMYIGVAEGRKIMIGDYSHKTIGSYAPFAGNAKYINFIRVKDKSHFIDDMYTDYTSKDYDRDIKILDNNYRQIVNTTPNFKKNYSSGDSYIDSVFNVFYNNKIDFKITYIQEGRKKISKGAVSRLGSFDINFREIKTNKVFLIVLEDIIKIENLLTGEVLLSKGEKKEIFDFFIQDAISTSKQNNPIMSIWNITRLLADKLSNNAKQASTKWNLILSKDLGYSGFADKSGKGYIHPSEPMQAVFFNTKAFTLLHRVENTKAKVKASNKDIIIRKLMDVSMIGEERKEDFSLNLLFSKDEKKIIRYKGNFRIEKINVKEMPYQIEEIDGSFYAKNVKLTSFKNFPIEIKKDLYLVDLPYIDSLKGITEFVHGDLFIDKNLLDIFGEKEIRSKCNIKGDIIVY